MDNNMIGQNNYIGSVNYGKQAEKKAPVKPQEEFVTEWQMSTEDVVSFQAPVKEKAPSKPKEEMVTDWQMPVETKTPEKPAETASRVPVTLRMDDWSLPMVIKDHGEPFSSLALLDDGAPSLVSSLSKEAFAELLKKSGPVVIGFDTSLMADPSTAFYKIGMNTINSIARDGIFTVDGEQLAKPGA